MTRWIGFPLLGAPAQAAEEAMGHAPVTTILGTPKVVAELYSQVEEVETPQVVLEEEEQGPGDEALLTWVEGGDSYALVVRKLNVIGALVGITTNDGRRLVPTIADRIR